jgi:hypothetical protein
MHGTDMSGYGVVREELLSDRIAEECQRPVEERESIGGSDDGFRGTASK